MTEYDKKRFYELAEAQESDKEGEIIQDNPVEVRKMLFSFEAVPMQESWYSSYQRLYRGDELVFHPSSTTAPFLLPYEMPYNTFEAKKSSMRDTDTSRDQIKASSPVRQLGSLLRNGSEISEYDQLVADDVDPVLLDCQEDEFLTGPPLGDPMDMLDSYSTCTCKSRVSSGKSPKDILPAPCRKISPVPESPEKLTRSLKLVSKCSNSEQSMTPVGEVKIVPKTGKLSRSLSRGGKKLRERRRSHVPSPSTCRDPQESFKNSMKLSDDDKVRVGKVAPSVQNEINKKTFKNLDIDFPVPKRIKKLAENPRKVPVPVTAPLSDSDSDFESPNLLAKKSRSRGVVNPVKKTVFASDDKSAKPKKVSRKSKSVKKAANRWGIEVSDITNSQKKRLQNQKQSKIDGFFKNPPPSKDSDFIRINHADTVMELALKLSKAAKEEKNGDVEKDFDEEVDKEQAGPGFGFVRTKLNNNN